MNHIKGLRKKWHSALEHASMIRMRDKPKSIVTLKKVDIRHQERKDNSKAIKSSRFN